MKELILLFISIVFGKECYWNSQNPYALFGGKTPYDTIRGDIRDYALAEDCEIVSVWRLNRQGNSNPPTANINEMKQVLKLKDEIIASFEAGTSQLCAQDIENFRKWTWQSSIDESHSYLTKVGYEEIYQIGKRFAEQYRNLLQGTPDQFYLRATNEQRTIASCTAFVHGLTDWGPLNVTVGEPQPQDDVIRPYETCDRYKKEVKEGPILAEQEDAYFKSSEYISVLQKIQSRLGISTRLTANQVLAIYQICRYYRTWTDSLKSPWCAVFSNEDLVIMEYFDDVSSYYKKGYGSWVNVYLGEAPLKDLYENFKAVVAGNGKKLVAYFSHGTMMDMMYSALGMYFDGIPIKGSSRNPNRLWRTSFSGSFACNLMAVLNRCRVGQQQEYRVQFFINEMTTPICPPKGCSWLEFQDKFDAYTNSNLDFCNMSIPESLYRKSKDKYYNI